MKRRDMVLTLISAKNKIDSFLELGRTKCYALYGLTRIIDHPENNEEIDPWEANQIICQTIDECKNLILELDELREELLNVEGRNSMPFSLNEKKFNQKELPHE